MLLAEWMFAETPIISALHFVGIFVKEMQNNMSQVLTE
jgi:hypothetical protein